MGALGEQLKDYWRRDGVSMRPGATAAEIVAFESKFGVRMPDDLLDYFESVNGFDLDATGWCDRNCFSFFPLHKVVPLSTEWWKCPEGDNYFAIVDFLISSHVYAIYLSKDRTTESAIVVAYNDGERPTTIGNSFTEFAHDYLEGKPTILGY